MAVREVEAAAGPEEMRDDGGPAFDVGEPHQRAPAHEDEVEAGGGVDGAHSIVEVGLDEAGAPGEAEVARQVAGGADRGGGEVQAGDAGAVAREDEAVVAEMALQVEHVEAGDGAELLALDRIELGGSGAQGGHVIEGGADVDGDGLVPGGAVGGVPVCGIVRVGHGSVIGMEQGRRQSMRWAAGGLRWVAGKRSRFCSSGFSLPGARRP